MNDRKAAGLIATCLQRAIADENPNSLAHEVRLLGSCLLAVGDPDERGLRAFCEWDARMMDDVVEWIMSARGDPQPADPRLPPRPGPRRDPPRRRPVRAAPPAGEVVEVGRLSTHPGFAGAAGS